MKHLKTFENFSSKDIFENVSPKRKVSGTLKKFIFIYDEDEVEIGCKFTGTYLEEIDLIEKDKNHKKYFKSTQVSDKGTRPVEMKYEPSKGISWEQFVEKLQETFDRVFA